MKTTATKYTPGPWTAQEGKETCFHAGNRYSITAERQCGVTGDPEDEVFMETVAEIWPTSGDSDKHDARLIAAAPELLEALQMVLDETKAGMWDCLPVEKARAAVPKAKGETP